MAFGVFIHRADSIYDDSPAERYQFPRQYLGRVQACVGDWIVYYEPRRIAGTRGYFAVAKITQVVPDPSAAGMYFAIIEPGSYLDFANPVPFSGDGEVIEQGLLNAEGAISGRARSAVRPISARDFSRIVQIGLAPDNTLLTRDPALQSGLQEDVPPFLFEQERIRKDFVSNRIVRDRVFRQVVLSAYDSRCAITGLKLINGGGRAEVVAAHIRPVEKSGPDIVNNGIALSGTVHWMFDRGLIGLSDDLTILISRQVNDQSGVRAMINASGHALSPRHSAQRPHPHFLEWHRTECFKN